MIIHSVFRHLNYTSCDIVWSKNNNELETYLNLPGAIPDHEQIILDTIRQEDVNGISNILKHADQKVIGILK